MASRFVFFPVLVLLHEDLVFARLHLRVVLDGAARLDQQLVDAPEREKEGRRCKSFSIVSIVPRVTRRRQARVPSAAKAKVADTLTFTHQ